MLKCKFCGDSLIRPITYYEADKETTVTQPVCSHCGKAFHPENDAEELEAEKLVQVTVRVLNHIDPYHKHTSLVCKQMHHDIKANDYQKEALRTANGMDYNPDSMFDRAGMDSKKFMMLLNGILGLSGEVGECADIVKKFIFQGHELDKKHLAEELGDVAWYLATAAYALDYSFSDILVGNEEKLQKRYPNGFDSERSVHREKYEKEGK